MKHRKSQLSSKIWWIPWHLTKNRNHCHQVRMMLWFHKNKVKYPTSFTVLFLSLFFNTLRKKVKIKMICCLYINSIVYFVRAALKVMSPALFCWPIRGGYWCYGSRGWIFPQVFHYLLFPVWQMAAEGQSDKMVSDMEAKVFHWISSYRKKLNPLVFTDAFLIVRPNSECEHSEVVSRVPAAVTVG